jgi:hypothetical protein
MTWGPSEEEEDEGTDSQHQEDISLDVSRCHIPVVEISKTYMLMLFSIMNREWEKNADGCSRKSVTKVSIYLSITVGLQWKKGW